MDDGSAPPNSVSSDRPRRRILVVENDDDTLFHLRRHLESLGHEVHSVRSAHDAENILTSTSFDLLLCDIGLPDRDGWSLLEDLDDHRPATCVAMSDHRTQLDVQRSRQAGFEAHLIKPFLLSDLNRFL